MFFFFLINCPTQDYLRFNRFVLIHSCWISHYDCLCPHNQESETDQEIPEGQRAAGQGGLRGWEEIPGKGENGVHVQAQLLQDGVRLQV